MACFDVTGFELNGLPVSGLGFLHTLSQMEEGAQIVVGVRIIWRKLDHPAISGFGLVQTLMLVEKDRQVVMSLGVIGVQCDGVPVCGFGSDPVPEFRGTPATLVEQNRMIWCNSQSSCACRQRLCYLSSQVKLFALINDCGDFGIG